MSGSVVIYSPKQNEPEHERACHIEVGRRLAWILERRFDGYSHGSSGIINDGTYVLATDTLLHEQAHQALGPRTEEDFFGGIVPYAFMAGTALTHPLVNESATAPAGWSHGFGQKVQHAVLSGFTAFSWRDAMEAGNRLLNNYGALCIKAACRENNDGEQPVIHSANELEAVLETNAWSPEDGGIVLEEALHDVQMYFVGQVQVANVIASYLGEAQPEETNDDGDTRQEVRFIVTRGNYRDLLALNIMTPTQRIAIAQAQVYDRASNAVFPDFIASRRRYDVACGQDSRGQVRCGVLDHVWHPDLHSTAEVLALEVLHARPDINTVKTATLELSGDQGPVPPNAIELFNGVDKKQGLLRKYVLLERYETPA